MGFVIGAMIGLGFFIAGLAWRKPHPVSIPRALWQVVISGAGAGAVGYLLFTVWPLVVCCAVVGGSIPQVLVQSYRKKKITQQQHAWPDVLDDVVASLRAGLSISQSLTMVAQRGPVVMRDEFARCAYAIRAHGNADWALDNLKAEFSDPMADRVIEAMRLSHELGGRDLATMLSRLARVVREDNRARGELLARQSWTVNGARLAAAAPWILLALFATRPGTIEAFRTASGVAVLCAGIVVTSVAYLAMTKLGQLPADARIFYVADGDTASKKLTRKLARFRSIT